MVVLYIYLTIALVGSLVTFFGILDHEDILFSTPKEVYDTFITLNWFGAIIIFIVMILLAPIPYSFYFIRLLFTVGRK